MLAAVLAAAATLSACGTAAPTAGSTASSPPAKTAVQHTPSCHQQYLTWKHGPAKAHARRLEAALRRVQAVGGAEDIPLTVAAIKRAGRAARVMQAWPMPRCADPKGLYGKMLARITAAGDNATQGSGLGSRPAAGRGAAEAGDADRQPADRRAQADRARLMAAAWVEPPKAGARASSCWRGSSGSATTSRSSASASGGGWC